VFFLAQGIARSRTLDSTGKFVAVASDTIDEPRRSACRLTEDGLGKFERSAEQHRDLEIESYFKDQRLSRKKLLEPESVFSVVKEGRRKVDYPVP